MASRCAIAFGGRQILEHFPILSYQNDLRMAQECWQTLRDVLGGEPTQGTSIMACSMLKSMQDGIRA
jgi:hypothetical protein